MEVISISRKRMEQISSVRDLIDLWPARKGLADACGVPVARVHKWAEVGSIPAKYHLAVLNSALGAGYPVTADLMVRLHAQQLERAA
jgi:hypothetical protein